MAVVAEIIYKGQAYHGGLTLFLRKRLLALRALANARKSFYRFLGQGRVGKGNYNNDGRKPIKLTLMVYTLSFSSEILNCP